MSTTIEKPQPAQRRRSKLNAYPFWSPRFWHGMRMGDWWTLVKQNRFRMHPLRVPMAMLITPCAAFNSTMHYLQQRRFGQQLDEVELKHPPVFIIGHWRSGTTYLHELMVRDDRFGYPTTYECFAPSHFLVTGGWMPKLIWFLLPSKRPMDNMAAGFDHPQEDEFALCALGAPTPYLRMAFPNAPAPFMEFLDMEDVDPADLERWQYALTQFLKQLTFLKGKQLILKSPPHTGRVQILSQMFPGARFIHIVRDPLSIFPSTRRLWKSLDAAQGFQHPRHEHLDEYVFESFERMYGGFEKQREAIDPAHICDVRYEDLVRNPVEEVRAIYEKLDLGDFQHMQPTLEAYVSKQRDYRPNQHHLEPELVREISRRWAGYIEKYGYGPYGE